MNNKKLLTILLFLVVIIITLLFFINMKNNQKQFCTTTIYSKFKIPNHNASYKVDMKIGKTSDNSGYIKLLGTITVDKTYSINRIVYFKLKPNSEQNNLNLFVDFESKAKNDNVSDVIFNQYFKVFTLNSSGYVEINEVAPQLYLFSSSLGPYFICMLQDEISVI